MYSRSAGCAFLLCTRAIILFRRSGYLPMPLRARITSALALIVLSAPILLAAVPQSPDAARKLKNRSPHWSPPALDSPVRATSSTPPCALANVLEQAAASTSELVTNLQNFTAQEKVTYQSIDRQGFVLEAGSEAYNYVVIFQHAPGKPVVEESRNPTHGSTLSSVAGQSRGLPELVLMFLPNIQDDYEMKCEGSTDWEGRRTWVVHFQQRPDKPSRTFSFDSWITTYSASLKGHAWIAADSGEVVHLETGLMRPIPATQMHQWSLSIDYAPVRFRTRDVSIWLPEFADAYYDFGDHRTIVYHTFTDFMLFSTQIEQKIEKPKVP
jgi:hypothetical protein